MLVELVCEGVANNVRVRARCVRAWQITCECVCEVREGVANNVRVCVCEVREGVANNVRVCVCEVREGEANNV